MHMSQHSFLAAALLGGLLAVGALPAWAANAEVTIDNFTFSPAQITVPAGTRVTWTNRDDIPHTVTDSGNPRAMKSPPLDTGETFAFTFDKPGDYRYFCSLHPHMQGTVVVEAAHG
jgi:plastocyanin